MQSFAFKKWAKEQHGLTEWSQQSDWRRAWEQYQYINQLNLKNKHENTQNNRRDGGGNGASVQREDKT